MATKRMFSSKIVDSDAFLDMPQTSQLLYFHLAMRTDDDGFVGNPRKIMRMIGSAENDMAILFTKKFILGFESGIIVIKHHRINNNWDSHNCKRTQYVDEFNMLHLKENGSYTFDNTQGLLAQTEIRLKSDEKKSLEENRIEENRIDKNIHFVTFWEKYPPRRKVDKTKCEKKFCSFDEQTQKLILDDVIKRSTEHSDWLKEEGQFVPAPIVYLNKQIWETPIIKAKNNTGRIYG